MLMSMDGFMSRRGQDQPFLMVVKDRLETLEEVNIAPRKSQSGGEFCSKNGQFSHPNGIPVRKNCSVCTQQRAK